MKKIICDRCGEDIYWLDHAEVKVEKDVPLW